MLDVKKVHEDKRGEIYADDNLNIVVFFTNKGFARGGQIHKKNKEYLVLIKGEIESHQKYKNKKWFKYTLNSKGDFYFPSDRATSIIVEKNTSHYFVSLTDSIIVEWGVPQDDKEKDPPTRKIVNDINKKNLEKKKELKR